MVGIISVGAGLFVPAGGAWRARLQRDGNCFFARLPQPFWNVPRLPQLWMGSGPPWAPQVFCALSFRRGAFDSVLRDGTFGIRVTRAGSGGRILWHGLDLGLRNHRQRNLPNKFTRPWLGIYLHWRASDEFRVSLCDWEDRRSEGIELGFLPLRRGISASWFDGYAVAGDEG